MRIQPSRRDLLRAPFAKGQYQIASLLVQARPQLIAALGTQLNDLDGVEVHDTDAAKGKMILIIEAKDDRGLLGAIRQVEQTKGVITTSLVYHQIEEDDEQ